MLLVPSAFGGQDAPAQLNKVAVYINAAGSDSAGNQLVYAVREEIRRSSGLVIHSSKSTAAYVLEIITLEGGGDYPGHSTIYSYVIAVPLTAGGTNRIFIPPWSSPSDPERRRGSVLSAFKRAHPCPSTGKRAGPCPGWAMDHVIPLACRGVDALVNIQWLPTAMWREKSKWERKIYLRPGDAPTEYCKRRR